MTKTPTRTKKPRPKPAPDKVTRPKLKRNRPIRAWAGVFGPPEQTGASRDRTSASPDGVASPDPRKMPESVELGYRVVEEYLREGQRAARAFNPMGAMGRGSAPGGPAPEEMAQRLMQYGWDFAGLWLEMASRMTGGAGPWPTSPPRANPPPASEGASRPAAAEPFATSAHGGAGSTKVSLSVNARQKFTATVELERATGTAFEVHALRPKRGRAKAIAAPSIRMDGDAIRIAIEIPEDQPAGDYLAPIVDAQSNLPVGRLSVRLG